MYTFGFYLFYIVRYLCSETFRSNNILNNLTMCVTDWRIFVVFFCRDETVSEPAGSLPVLTVPGECW